MKITFVIGKGGVGKTTVSALLGLERKPALVFSLDPLPNLAQLFGTVSSFEPLKVEEGLYVGEVDDVSVKEWWMKRFGDEMGEVISSILKLNETEKRELLRHIASAPGVAEQFVLLHAIEKAELLGVEELILDTPPLGPTLHMLRAEREFYDHLVSAYGLYAKIMSKLGLFDKRVLEIIKSWSELAKKILNAVSSSKYVLVTTKRKFDKVVGLKGAEEMESFGSSLEMVVLNMVEDGPECVKEPTYWLPKVKEPTGVEDLKTLATLLRRAC